MKKYVLLYFIILILFMCNCLITKKTNHITRKNMEEISGNQPFLMIKIKNNKKDISKEFILMMNNIYESIIDQINISDIDISCLLNEEIILVEEESLLISTINERYDIYNLEPDQLIRINNIISQKYIIRNTYDTEENTAYLIFNLPLSIINNKKEINIINNKIIKILQNENLSNKYDIYFFNTKITNKTTYEKINKKYISFNIILDTNTDKGAIKPEILNIIHTIKTECSDLKGVLFTTSISDSIININDLLNNQRTKTIPDNIQLIQQLLLLLELSGGNIHNLINIDYSRAEIQITVDNMSSRQYFKLLAKIDKITENYKSYFNKIYIYREDI